MAVQFLKSPFWLGCRTLFRWVIGIFVAIATIGGVYSFYKEVTSGISLSAQVISATDVFDVHQSVQSLQVLFRGTDIEQSGKNLEIYDVKIENSGGESIAQGNFDQNLDWGISVEGGEIVGARLLSTGSQYLTDNLGLEIVATSSLIKFNKVILESGDWFTTEIVVLYDKDTPPALYRIGKILGIKDQKTPISPYTPQESFWTALTSGSFHGGVWVNIVRFLAYFIVSTILAFFVLVVIAAFVAARKRAKQAPQAPQQPSDFFDGK